MKIQIKYTLLLRRFKLLVVCVLIIFSCKNETSETKLQKVKKEAPDHFGLLKGTDSVAQKSDSLVTKYIYAKVQIDVENHPSYNGDIVTVSDNVTSKTFEIGVEYSCFFKGLVNNLIIIDTGTGQSRGLEVYSTTGELVLDAEYINELEIDGDQLLFWSPIETEAVAQLPDCFVNNQNTDFGIGLIAKNQYNLKSRSLETTGEIDCQFYE